MKEISGPNQRKNPKEIQYIFHKDNMKKSEPGKYSLKDLKSEEMILNLGP